MIDGLQGFAGCGGCQPRRPTKACTTAVTTSLRQRTLFVALSVSLGLAGVGSVGVFASGSAAADNPLPPSQARAFADAARATREAAESRLAGLITQRDALSAKLGSLSSETQDLAKELERAQQSVREHAVASFIDRGSSQGFVELIVTNNVNDASARRTLLASRTQDAIDAAATFQRLKDQNDPSVVALADQLDAVDRQVTEAEGDVIQARGYEADAERQLAQSEDAARQAAAAAAAASSTSPVAAAPLARTGAATAPSAAVPTASPVPPVAVVQPGDDQLPPPPPGGPSEDQWAALRNCESGGNYQAVSRSGTYRGAYQFSVGTWAGVGGVGDPATASKANQDLRAKILYSRSGSNPWPVCGRLLR